MNKWTLVRKNLTRNKLRLFLNSLAIFIAFFLFGALGSIKNAFDAGVELSADDRLVIVNKINFTQPLPFAYVNKTRAVEGVEHLTYANWFGGYYQDPREQVQTFAVDPETYFDVYPELLVESDALKNWRDTRQGILVGRAIADKYGWEVGDKTPISSNIFFQRDGNSTWDFVVSGIFRGDDASAPTNYVLMHYDYFIETQSFGGEWIGWMVLTTGDPANNERVSKAIDENFQNSSAETETTTEAAFNQSFIEQMGDVGFILQSVVLAAFFTILLIVGNSMMLSIRERTRELAVMKTLGFSNGEVFRMVLLESILLAFIGGIIGLMIAELVVAGMAKTPEVAAFLPGIAIGTETRVIAFLAMFGLGFVTGFLPALRALNLSIIDALSRE